MNIYDVAKKAGVSIATVSRVINNSPNVSEKTRMRVKEIMRLGEYVPNAFARGLGLDTMKMVGVMCTDVNDPFYAAAVGQVEALLRAWGKDTVLRCTGNNTENKVKCLRELVNRKVDAVMLIGSAFREERDNEHIREAAMQVPVVIINGCIELDNVYCVVCDERGAVRDLVKTLASEGKRKPLYLYDATTYSGNEKLCGFSEGCSICGLEERIVRTERDIESTVSKVLEVYSSSGFDCVIACEDLIAVGALKALEELKTDLPVIGFNNSVISQCTSPSLTSVDNMLESMCQSAVRLLSDLDNGDTVPAKTVISARLVRRESY
ncbi:MAG: LacI family transcriptional regulator [Ruminococcaceae bacterium]|nr:LacI family transcriptional regulator [Oscillospiraceae bacterium]